MEEASYEKVAMEIVSCETKGSNSSYIMRDEV
jgi:hypothetical protein